ncbi:hypothetical protein MRX96_015527 [Rhipicephalus microplus]
MMEDLEVVARKELGETFEVIKESIDKFRKLLQEETDLIPPPDYVLLMFLRARKYRVDDAVKSLKNFFRLRSSHPEYYDNFLPSAVDYQTITREHNLFLLSKDRDSQGRIVGLARYGAWNSSICSLNELMKSMLMAVECVLLEKETQIRGIVAVDDLAGLGMHHIIHMTPGLFRVAIAIAQDAYPPFLSEKLKERVHLLRGGLPELRGVIPSDLIPKEYGGTFEDFDVGWMERYLLDKQGHFEVMSQCGYATNCSDTSTAKNEMRASDSEIDSVDTHL